MAVHGPLRPAGDCDFPAVELVQSFPSLNPVSLQSGAKGAEVLTANLRLSALISEDERYD